MTEIERRRQEWNRNAIKENLRLIELKTDPMGDDSRAEGWAMERVTILVVDDDLAIRRALKTALARAGFDVTTAASGDEAIGLFKGTGFKYQAIVTDINLHGRLNGWDVAWAAREADASVPVVYMTGDCTDEWSSKGVSNSVMLSKPFAFELLLTAISDLVGAKGR